MPPPIAAIPPHAVPSTRARANAHIAPSHWDLFCRVIDNFGDIGVCWRLACQLASRGQTVRLWVDDPRALAWMAPQGCAQVQVLRWPAPEEQATWPQPGEVVVECFGCDPPAGFVERMVQCQPAPVWINLEYLSAEAYVERSHGLRSPQANGLTKWFFYPGFTLKTGGLLREDDLLARQAHFDGPTWLAERGWAPRPGERVVSLFCYDHAHWPRLLAQLGEQQPTLLLAAPGPATALAQRALEQQTKRPQQGSPLRMIALPWLSQADYDHLLWSCSLNLVRGEDSFVRAQWAGQPFLWNIYPQEDGVHAQKLHAFLHHHLAGATPELRTAVSRAMQAWNGLGEPEWALPNGSEWQALSHHWRSQLAAQASLVQQLLDFVAQKR